MSQKWVTVAEARHVLGMAERTIRRHIQEGTLQSKLDSGRRWVLVEVAEDTMSKDTPTGMSDAVIDRLEKENELIKNQLSTKDKQIENLQAEVKESRERSDTIILQLTRQLEQSQRMLEAHREPFWQRWFKREK